MLVDYVIDYEQPLFPSLVHCTSEKILMRKINQNWRLLLSVLTWYRFFFSLARHTKLGKRDYLSFCPWLLSWLWNMGQNIGERGNLAKWNFGEQNAVFRGTSDYFREQGNMNPLPTHPPPHPLRSSQQGRSQDFSKGGSHWVKQYRHGIFATEYCRLFAYNGGGRVTGTPGPP